MSSKVTTTLAAVIRTRPLQETSLLVDFITRDYGRISAIARGARNPKSPLKSLLQYFVPLKISFSGSAGGLRSLRLVDGVAIPYSFQPPLLFSAMYLNELISRTYRVEESDGWLYELYMRSLNLLHQQMPVELILREFELVLLDNLGYGINLFSTRDDEAIQPQYKYAYNTDDFVLVSQEEDAPNVFLGQDLIKIRERKWDLKSLQVAKYLCQYRIQTLLHDEPLQTRQLYAAYMKLQRSATLNEHKS